MTDRARLDVRGYVRAVLLNDDRLRRGDRATLAVIGLLANAYTGETFAKAITTGAMTHLTVGAVRRCIDRLEAFGHVIVTKRPGRSSLLRLPVTPAEVIPTPRPRARGDTTDPAQKGALPRALGRAH